MSLILEALRKSEAERKRGQAPGLFAPMPAPPSRRRRTPVWTMLAGVLVIGLLVFGVIRFWPSAADPTAIETITTDAPDKPVEAGTTKSVSDTTIAPAATPPTPVSPAPPPSPAQTPIPAAPAPVAIAPAAPPPLPTPLPAANEPVTDYLPSLASLPPDQRANLPPLKLSMHVWSDQPARRIAIIDGQRVGEGASLSGAVVAEIRRDGVALDIDGQRYLLPRP
ncbi:general secretion pathway protein GspB [Arenimonas sp.]|uniref:general secretion pathway protein GspB n=1 Tax=Arenimonas sp. TaxID=1872635 RepID=UPI0039E565FC